MEFYKYRARILLQGSTKPFLKTLLNLIERSTRLLSHRKLSIMLFPILTVGLISGCTSLNYNNRPMTSSLTALTSESYSRTTSLINYSELLSVAGLLPMPDVGIMYHQPDKDLFGGKSLGPFNSVGIARNPGVNGKSSYRVIAEIDGVGEHDVISAANSIDELNNAAEESVVRLLRQSVINLQLQQDKEALSALSKDDNSDSDAKAAKSLKDQKELLQSRITKLETQKREIESLVQSDKIKFLELRKRVRELTSKTGLFVVTWTTNSNTGVKASTGGSPGESAITPSSIVESKLGVESEESKSGIAVLGGLKISLLFFAEDYMKMMASAQFPSYQELLKHVGITTGLMQTKFIAYRSTTDLKSSLSVQARFEANKLVDITPDQLIAGMNQIDLDSYLSNESSLSNKGTVGNVKWYRDDVKFSHKLCESKTKDSESKGSEKQDSISKVGCEFHNMPKYSERGQGKEAASSQYDGWLTIQAIQTRLDGRALEGIIKDYKFDVEDQCEKDCDTSS